MYKNKKGRRGITFLIGVFACLLFTIICLIGCAKSKTHSDGADASDGFDAQDEASTTVRLSDGDTIEEENDGSNGSIAWDSDTVDRQLETDASRIPREVPEPLLSLSEPDFTQPVEALAEQGCGYIFTAESSTEEGNSSVVETRAFDAEGRLIGAEISLPQELGLSDYGNHSFRRLQIAYDDAGRPALVRIGPLLDNGSVGSVIHIAYEDDGSSSSSMITSDFWQLSNDRLDTFCETLRFDTHGNLTERTWGCDEEVVIQTRSYDERQRPLFDETNFVADLDIVEYVPLEWSIPRGLGRDQWRIDYFYDDENNQTSAVWKEWEDGWYGNRFNWQSHEQVEQRLVKTYDESGQLMSVEFDGGNDGTIDERAMYTYRDGELLSVETDFWVDGIVDIIEIHDDSPKHHRIEYRNMTAYTDSDYFFRTVLEPWDRTAVMDITSIPPIQSQIITDMIYNDQTKIDEIVVEEKILYSYNPDAASMETEIVPVSATWRETREYADRGYVKSKAVVWQPSELYLDAIDRDQSPDGVTSVNSPGERFRYTNNETTCVLKTLCDTGEVVLPKEMTYLTCDVGVVFPEYHHRSVGLGRPIINHSGRYYAVPPYDAVPGIQNVLRSYFYATAVPPPPDARDILDY